MKKIFLGFLILFVLSLILVVAYSSQRPTLINLLPSSNFQVSRKNITKLQGKHFSANPDKPLCSPSDPEGCQNPGYFTFLTENGEQKVQFSLPGSDIIQSGNYTQKGRQIKITTVHGETIQATVSATGQELKESKTNTTYYYVEEEEDKLPPENTYDPNDPLSRPQPLDTDNAGENLQACQTDTDCVPEPTCHSVVCINKKYLGQYPDKSTLACTEIYTPCEAGARDCLCQNNQCVNTRLNTVGCQNWKEKLNSTESSSVTTQEAPQTQTACLQAGGRWELAGNSSDSHYFCNLPTTDGGKKCTDSSRCESYCEAPEGATKGEKTTGKCYPWQHLLEYCFREVNNGVADAESCI